MSETLMKPAVIMMTAMGCIFATSCGLVGGRNPDLRIFDYQEGKVVATIPAKQYRELPCNGPLVQGFFFTMTREGNGLVLRKRDKDGKEARRYELPMFSSVFHAPHLFSVSRDGKKIAYWARDDHDLHVRDLESGNDRIVFSYKNPEASCYSLDWTPGGGIVMAIEVEHDISRPLRPTIHRIDPNGGVKSREFKGVEMMCPYMLLSPDGRWICAIFDDSPASKKGVEPGDQVALIDVGTLAIKYHVPHLKSAQRINVIRWAADSNTIAYILEPESGKGGDVYVYDIRKNATKKIAGPDVGGVIGSDANEMMISLKNSLRLYNYLENSWRDAIHHPDGSACGWIPGTTRLVITD
jgi:WD40 repeat protein